MSDGKVSIEVRGIPVVFDTNAMNSFTMMRKIAHSMNGSNPFEIVEAIEQVFDDEQLDNIMEQLSEDGVECTAEDMTAFFFEAMGAASAEKMADSKN